jgi:hypothetical protein
MPSVDHSTACPVRRSDVPRRPDVVPYITAWSTENALATVVVAARSRQGARVAYADESPFDRDDRGVLWRRVPARAGQGRPLFAAVHGARQRRAMRRLLCQVCGGPADRDERGVLWLLGADPEGTGRRPADWPESLVTRHPPVCLGCARKAVHLCPYLGREMTAVRVAAPRLYGVYGVLYRPALPLPSQVTDASLPYGHPGLAWLVAAQQLRSLHGCIPVNLDREPGPR